ncbi:MAG: OmpA family protein [Alphaproteobacteria bacterium]|nr:OmpA family protein [Alphaproteobacteria bacterium]
MFNFKFRDKTNTWPAFVDLFSNLVIILIFLLIVFVFLWTTTSVFNKSTGVKTIAELKQTNAEQSEQIRQMKLDEEEATRLLIMARSRLQSAETDLESKELSIIDLITAYENQVNALQAQDEETKKQMAELREQLNQALVAKQQIADLEQERKELQTQMQEQMAEKSAEYLAELKKLNNALAAAEESAKEQEVKYVEMSTRLNKALADKVAELEALKKYQSDFYRSIKMALGDTTSVQEDGDRFIVPSDILFQTGSYRLSAEGKNQVRLLSHVIKGLEEKIPTNIDWIIRIDGHTDKKPVVPGNRSYADNMQLSILRARAVMNELVRDGVSPRRLVPSGFGDLHPIELGTDAASMQKNRRIELKLTNK